MIRSLIALSALFCIGAAPDEPATLIRGARVFDGTGATAKVQDVLVRGDRIVAVGRHVKAPRDAKIVDAEGMTLLPGLHDLHIHTRRGAFESTQSLAQAYRPYLDRGITSVNEYSVAGPMLAGIRSRMGPEMPHLKLAIRLGVPHGHGTESDFTNSITFQVTTPAEAHAAMLTVLAYKPDVVKVFADGWRYGDPERPDRPSMDLPTLTAIVKDAHRAGIAVVTHTVTLEGAKLAARADVDAVVHGVGDALVDRELIRLMKRSGMAYVPTLATYEPQEDRRFLPVEWALLAPRDRAREEERMAKPIAAVAPYDAKRWGIMEENVRRLHNAGIRIGVGTDTGISGVYPGSATIREMRLLVKLGLTPAEALEAATSTAAKVLRQPGHGRIAKGQRADLALIAGRPDKRIEDVYRVRRVWVAGREVQTGSAAR